MKKKIIVDGQETKYSVTDDGRIYNDTTGKELKGTYKTNEYHSVQLLINGHPRTFMFHRLVAEAFCENPNHYTIVDHIDRNKHNDNANNLRWVDSKTNALNCERSKARHNQKYEGNFSEEGWIPAFGYEETHMINYNTIEVVNRKTKNILIPQERNGYQRINMGTKRVSLHVLLWESYNKRKVPDDMEIDHIDGNKKNNNISNLKLATRSENMKNAYRNGHENQVAVKQYSLDGKYLATYPSISVAAETVNAQKAGLKEATNRHGTCAGYYWLRETDPITIEEVMYNWIPEGYKLIEEYPTYCINQEGQVYNKRNKKNCPIKFRSDDKPFILIKNNRINIEDLLYKYWN